MINLFVHIKFKIILGILKFLNQLLLYLLINYHIEVLSHYLEIILRAHSWFINRWSLILLVFSLKVRNHRTIDRIEYIWMVKTCLNIFVFRWVTLRRLPKLGHQFLYQLMLSVAISDVLLYVFNRANVHISIITLSIAFGIHFVNMLFTQSLLVEKLGNSGWLGALFAFIDLIHIYIYTF